MKKKLPLLQAIAVLVGTTVGAGILGLPYVFAQAGFWTGFLVLVVVGLAMLCLNLMFGEIVLRTTGQHQISGYVEKYLGKFWKRFVSVFLAITLFGALLAYFVAIGQALAAIVGGPAVLFSLLFYVVFAALVFKGVGAIKNAEFILGCLVWLVFFILIIFSWPHVKTSHITAFDFKNILAPLGVLLFAYSGSIAIPAMKEILVGKEKLFKKAILTGVLIPGIFYAIFSWAVVGATGLNTSEVATIGLGQLVGPFILVIGNVFACLTMSTGFLAVGLTLKEMFNYDYKIKHLWAWFLTMAVPLVIYFFGLHDFISILGLAGALGFGVEGVVYVLTFWHARKKSERQPEYVLSTGFAVAASCFLFLVFGSGLFYTLINIF